MIKELQMRVLPHQAASMQAIARYIAEEQAIDQRTIAHVRVLRRSIDARQRTIYVNLTVRVYINEEPGDDVFPKTVRVSSPRCGSSNSVCAPLS